MKKIINNGRIITPSSIIEKGSIVIENGIIQAILPYHHTLSDAEIIDAAGLFLSPGFIDIHIHGGGGFDFMDATEEAFTQIALTHLAHGTTVIMPTTLTSTKKELEKVLIFYEQFLNRRAACQITWLGMHIEGPYFSINHRGAQDPRFIRNPDKEEYLALLRNFNCISRWSIAPELDGALEMGDIVNRKKIIASVAHTDAVYSDIEKAVRHGYSLVTHLYSAMNGVIRRNAYRYAGTVEAALLMDELDVEIIADGKHLPVPLLQLVYKNKGADKIALITDAIRPAGTLHTTSVLGSNDYGIEVIVEDEVAKMPDRTSFAGSVATMDRLLSVMWKQAKIPLAETIKMMSTTPARIAVIIDKNGSLEIGKKADVVFFDEDVNIKNVMLCGEMQR